MTNTKEQTGGHSSTKDVRMWINLDAALHIMLQKLSKSRGITVSVLVTPALRSIVSDPKSVGDCDYWRNATGTSFWIGTVCGIVAAVGFMGASRWLLG
ncbi:MAG: hypothetical protein E4H01_11910 [Lysobacterales bacterium]|nr:MAG: hypothetical protein E4H01_11910 [Xanthomonadales bacterium]